jgi:hypothetical protein
MQHPRAAGIIEKADREQSRQHARKQVTLRFRATSEASSCLAQDGIRLWRTALSARRPQNCATQVIVLAYQPLRRRAPASATAPRALRCRQARPVQPRELRCYLHLPVNQAS